MASYDSHRLGVLEKGNLEDITKPPSSRSRPGSRVTSSNPSNASASSTSSRLRPQVAAALELLTPEEVMEQEFDLELEDYGGSSDETTEEDIDPETGRTTEMFRIAEPLREREVYMSEDTTLTEDDDDKQLAIYGSIIGDEDTQVDSDEENLIMKEIRAEITAQVRQEMKSELEMYQKKREALTSAIDSDKEKKPDPLDEEQDPKLREAIIKMRKLDRILTKKVKREKEVKRDRIILQRRLRDELANIKPEGGGREPKEVQNNTAKFLALALPPSHNIVSLYVDKEDTSGVRELPAIDYRVTVEEENDNEPTPVPPVTPLFATQYVDDEGNISSRNSNKSGKSKHAGDTKSEGASTSRSKMSQDGTNSQGGMSEDSQSIFSGGTSSTNLTGKSQGRKKKNFLKRNKELASDAANLIAMTEEEKQRVDNLLINVDALPEVPEEGSIYGDTPNPFQVVLADGEGFMPEVHEMRRLTDIDSRLKALMPPSEYESIASTPRSVQSRQSVLFTRTAIDTDGDMLGLGEQVLKETREERDFQKRLHEIEDELNTLTSAVEHEIESPRLSSNQLQSLLDQCANTMQRATQETDALANSQQDDIPENTALMLANAPRLEEDVLQKLLADARCELRISSSRQSDITPTPENQGNQLESISENNIQELLRDSRATSRNFSRNEAQPEYSAEYSPTPPPHRRTPNQSMGDHHFNKPYTNGFVMQPNTRTGMDNLHLASLDEDEMQALLASNGMDNRNTERRPFLPDIDPKGSLTTQRSINRYNMQNGESTGWDMGSRRSSGVSVHNAISDHSVMSSRDEDGTPTPHPPSSSRPSSGSAGKHRSIIGRTSVENP